jgi:hypothetical protein
VGSAGAQDGGRPAQAAVVTSNLDDLFSIRTHLSPRLAGTHDARTPFPVICEARRFVSAARGSKRRTALRVKSRPTGHPHPSASLRKISGLLSRACLNRKASASSEVGM